MIKISGLEEFEKIRFWLFTESYVAEQIAKVLRKKYGIKSKISYNDWQRKLLKEHIPLYEKKWIEWNRELKINPRDRGFVLLLITKEVEKEVTSEITLLADYLKLNEGLLRCFIIHNNVPQKLYPPERIFFVTPLSPLKKMGYYIKFDETLSEKEWIFLFRGLKKRIILEKKIEKELEEKHPGNKITQKKIEIKKKRKQFGKYEEAQILAYLSIEKKIKEIKKEKEKNKTKGIDKYFPDDYYSSLIERSIGEVTQEILDALNCDDSQQDRFFNKVQKKLETYYYTITRRYQLPTPKKLASILKLIHA